MTISAATMRAYRATTYRVDGTEVRIGQRATLTGVLLTAWNPRSRLMPIGWNRRMQHRLYLAIRRWSTQPASGTLGRWHEDHLCVQADPRACKVIARRFRQAALVILRRNHPSRLVLL